MDKLSHVNEQGKAEMVDISGKAIQLRKAIAEGYIYTQETTIDAITQNNLKKGDVLAVARIAGIQAAKMTPNLIPLCHTLLLNKVSVDFELQEKGIKATSQVSCNGTTGVEMEALTAVSVALLTIYDMCKAIDKTMKIGNIILVSKTKQ